MEMHAKTQTLARRLLGHYLMFGLMSIVVLCVAWALLGRTILSNVKDHEYINRIDEVRALLVTDFVENGGSGSKTFIQLLSMDDWVAYAGIIGRDGKYLAHSNPGRVGKTSDSHFQHRGVGLIERQIVRSKGQQKSEYWAPLEANGKDFGSLQVGVVQETSETWLKRLLDWIPYAILAPVLILGIGTIFLKRAARTSAAIEDQLCAVSAGNSISEFRLKPLNEPNPTAIGWNRLVERALGHRPQSSLESRLNQSLGNLHEKRSERILNSLSDGVALTDKDGCITFANRPFTVLLQQGADGVKLRGKPIREFFPPRTNLYMNTNQESRPAVFEVQLGPALADGVLRVGRTPMLGDESSQVNQHIWTIRDITQQKLADEMRNQFVYAAAHELRTPLTNIKAYAETLALDEMDDHELQKGFLNVINSEATRLARFVEELLNVSQMEAGALALSRSEVDLERLLVDVIEKVTPQMHQKHIVFDSHIPPKLPKLLVDKDKFTAALVNLLGNAAKYTLENGRVTFKVVPNTKDIQFHVEDTGIGISQEDLPKLFTKFFRSSDVRVRDVQGSGLGLAFAQEVTRLHGGKLTVHSELNKGTQFTMFIPIH